MFSESKNSTNINYDDDKKRKNEKKLKNKHNLL